MRSSLRLSALAATALSMYAGSLGPALAASPFGANLWSLFGGSSQSSWRTAPRGGRGTFKQKARRQLRSRRPRR